MEDNNFWANIFFAVVMLHLLIGFGYLMYKLSPKDDDEKET